MNRRHLWTIGLLFALFVSAFPEIPGAQTSDEILRKSSQEFSSRSGSAGILIFIIFFAFLAVLAIGLIVFDIFIRRRNKVGYDNPRYLFSELVRAHELTRVEKQFLLDFADESGMEDSLPLFVEPRYFLAALDDDRFQESHKMIEYLLKKLFDIDPESFVPLKKQAEKTLRGETTIIRPFPND